MSSKKKAFTPSDSQVGKLYERLLAAARKSGIGSGQFQAALAYPGTELEDGLLAVIVRFVKKTSGIVTPVHAQSTGLVPNGWKVRNDDLEGEISLNNLDYSSGPVQVGDGSFVEGSTMLARAGNAYGSLGFAAVLLKEQAEGKEIFPVESRGKHYFVMPRTILLDGRRRRRVAYFDWGNGSWLLKFGWFDNGFGDFARFVRPRENPLGA